MGGPKCHNYLYETEEEKGHAKTEAELTVTQPQAREWPEPPEAGKNKEGFSLRAFGGSVALLTP